MKGISPLIAAVLIIAISVSAIAVALSIGNPSIQRSKEILILNEGKDNLKLIDNAVNEVLEEGNGSSRKLTVHVTGGKYTISGNIAEFEMDTSEQVVGVGIERSEDVVYVEGSKNKIRVYTEYEFDFIGEKTFGQGTYMLVIANDDGDIVIS